MVGTKPAKWLPFFLIGSTLLFFYLPILIMIVFSFNGSRSLTNWAGFSTQWYTQLFNSRDMMAAVMTTVSIALISTVISTFVGTITAIGLSKSNKVIKETVLSILVYTMSKRINPTINALSTILVVIITIALVLVNVLPMLRKKERIAIE